MELTSPIQPGPGTAAAGSPATGDGAKRSDALNSDFETFLKMLTTQMRNQDPLNPVESADFAVQLATFSTVEQQVRTNDLLSGLGARLDTLGMGQLSGWIGLEAEARGPVAFTGDPVPLTAKVDPSADAAQLVVSDDQGRVVQRQDIAPVSGRVEWTGRGADGRALAPGTYTVAVQSSARGETLTQHDATMHGRIAEARLNAGETEIVLANGQSLSPSEIVSLRQPPDPL